MKISNERKKYISNLKKEKIIVFSWRLSLILLFLIIWEILSKYGIINTFIFSSPCNILKCLFNLLKDGTLIKHFNITLLEIIISFILSSSLGLIIATIMWNNKLLSKIIEPYLTILNSLPKIAIGPLIIIWIGASIKSIIFMSLLISTFITIINIYNYFINTEQKYILLMKSFNANKKQIFLKVVLPSNLKNIISVLKVNISMNLIGVIMGELLVSKKGIGYLIMYGSQIFDITLIITCVFILGIISYLMYILLEKIETKFKDV